MPDWRISLPFLFFAQTKYATRNLHWFEKGSYAAGIVICSRRRYLQPEMSYAPERKSKC